MFRMPTIPKNRKAASTVNAVFDAALKRFNLEDISDLTTIGELHHIRYMILIFFSRLLLNQEYF